ncbi:MAG TPA: hypothetical protein VGZ69_03330 [Candidatus Rhabdochlamydia sp.]|jgi:hypothetical protein|nr:hypothetical protein [Candidatus Rhabdochlamydia sp.]
MQAISDLIAEKKYLPVPEDVQQELVEIYGERRIKEDSLITKFAIGVLFGAISATFTVFICAPNILLNPPLTAFICASFIQLTPKQKSTDWKVHIIARLFFAVTCAIVIKHFLDLNGFLRSNPWFDQVIIRNSLIKNRI